MPASRNNFIALTMLALSVACSIPDERQSLSDADGGTAGFAAHHLGGKQTADAGASTSRTALRSTTSVSDGGRDLGSSGGGGRAATDGSTVATGLVVSAQLGGSASTAGDVLVGSAGAQVNSSNPGGSASSTPLTQGGAAGNANSNGNLETAGVSTRQCTARDCSSTNDNDCNGKADSTESECLECAQPSTRACDTHAGYDGVGACHAGHQELIRSLSECHWTECVDSQGPTLEACGPDKPDVNCNGVMGDGEWEARTCITRQTFCNKPGAAAIARSSCDTTEARLELALFASSSTTNPAMTKPVRSCSVGVSSGSYSSTTCNFVTVGDCQGGSAPLGYVAYSTTPLLGYKRLAFRNYSPTCSGISLPSPLVYVDGCTDCTETDYYVLPLNPLP